MATADRRVYLHVGAPKTGTTYLQALMGHNRAALKERGVLYPKTRSNAHHMAAWDLRGTPRQRRDVKGIEGTWQALVRRCNSWDGSTVVLSSELFVFCDESEIARALSAFEAEVHVIYTARDLVRQVPAAWQEEIKNQGTGTYGDFVGAVLKSRRPGRRHAFWQAQDTEKVLSRWTPDRDPTRVHLVTAPPRGQAPTVLWERFASVFLPGPTTLDAHVSLPDNASLTVLQTELLRRYNERHGAAMAWPDYRRTVRSQLEPIFVHGLADTRRLSLSQRQERALRAEADRIVNAVADGGYDVTGDLADLIPGPASEGRGPKRTAHPEDVEDELLGAALDALHEALSRRDRRPQDSATQPADALAEH